MILATADSIVPLNQGMEMDTVVAPILLVHILRAVQALVHMVELTLKTNWTLEMQMIKQPVDSSITESTGTADQVRTVIIITVDSGDKLTTLKSEE